jgi:excisionase family DNA binding protein
MQDTTSLIGVGEVAERLGVSTKTVRRYVAGNQLPAIRLGYRILRFDPAEVDAFIERRAS